MKLLAAATLLAAGATLAACQTSNGDTTPLTPTVIEPPSITESFSGSVQPGGSSSSSFTVSQVGSVAVTLTAAGPPATISMGLGIGNPDSTGTCQVLQANAIVTQAGTSPQLSGTVSQTGAYCVLVFDALRTQTGTVTYTLTVKHPK